LNPMNEII